MDTVEARRPMQEASQNATDAETETEAEISLEEPIKVEWSGAARTKFSGRCHTVSSSRDDDRAYKAELALRTLDRLKTRVVIESVPEAEAFLTLLDDYAPTHRTSEPTRVWMNQSQVRAFARVYQTVASELDAVTTDNPDESDRDGELVPDGGYDETTETDADADGRDADVVTTASRLVVRRSADDDTPNYQILDERTRTLARVEWVSVDGVSSAFSRGIVEFGGTSEKRVELVNRHDGLSDGDTPVAAGARLWLGGETEPPRD